MVCYRRPTVHVYLRNFVSVYSVVLRAEAAKTPIFVVFWTSAFSGVANWQQSEKVEHGCITTNLRLSNGIKILSVLQRLHGEIGRTSCTCNFQTRGEQTNKQANRQTKNSTFLAAPAAGEIHAPPSLAWLWRNSSTFLLF